MCRYGLSEEFLAAWLESREIDPLEVAVGTKWGYDYTAQWQVGQTSPNSKCQSDKKRGKHLQVYFDHRGLVGTASGAEFIYRNFPVLFLLVFRCLHVSIRPVVCGVCVGWGLGQRAQRRRA